MVNAFDILRDDLIAFAEYTFKGYNTSRHHIEIASALEAVECGQVKRLRIDAPHQRGKTELAIVRFVPWVLGKHPDWPIILISYGDVPVERFSRRALEVIKSPAYQSVFPHVKLSGKSQSVAIWELDGYRGGVRASGIGGAVNSFPCQGLIIDDAFKSHEEAGSEIIRESVWEFYKSVAYSRLAPDGWIINIGTRQNEDDLHGRLDELEKQGGDKWHHVHIQAINDSEVSIDQLIQEQKEHGEDWVDERYQHLVSCWPERWRMSQYINARINQGSLLFETQYQGRPYSPGGGFFKKDWFIISPSPPPDLKWHRVWDLATTEAKQGSFTCGILMAVDYSKTIWIRDVIRGKWAWPEARRRIAQTAHTDGANVDVLVERGAFQFGNLAKDLIDNWERFDIPIRGIRVQGLGDKIARANGWSARAEAGKVVLVKGDWNEAFLQECVGFPTGINNDQVDCVSLGYEVLAKSPLIGSDYEKITKPNTHRWWEQYRKEYGKLQQDLNGENRVIYAGSRVFDE